MGWLIYSASHSPRNADEEKAEIERLCTSENGYAPLRASKVGSTWYVAVQATGRLPSAISEYEIGLDGSYVFAAVFLTCRRDGGWGYKDMDECMGPCEAQAPAAVLNLLSPTTNAYALEWRRRCRDGAKTTSLVASLKDGQRIRLPQSLRFQNGAEAQEFVVTSYLKRGRRTRAYRNDQIGLCRLTAANLEGFSLV